MHVKSMVQYLRFTLHLVRLTSRKVNAGFSVSKNTRPEKSRGKAFILLTSDTSDSPVLKRQVRLPAQVLAGRSFVLLFEIHSVLYFL